MLVRRRAAHTSHHTDQLRQLEGSVRLIAEGCGDAGSIPAHCLGDAVAPCSVAEAIYEGEKLGRAL